MMSKKTETLIFKALVVVFSMLIYSPVSAESECEGEKCLKEEKVKPYEIYVVSHGERRPRAIEDPEKDTREYKDEAAKQENRRVDVSGIFKQTLPDGTRLNLSQDPVNIRKELAVRARDNNVELRNGTPQEDMLFDFYSNYPDFIERIEIDFYRRNKNENRLGGFSFSGPFNALDEFKIEKETLQEINLNDLSEEIFYIVKVYNDEGQVDMQAPQKLRVQTSDGSFKNDERNRVGERSYARVFGQNYLEEQSIVVKGSSVRIYGNDVPKEYDIKINDLSIPIDTRNDFALEFIKPTGFHEFDIELFDSKSGITWDRKLSTEVSDNYTFLVGLADATISYNSISGNAEVITQSDRYKENILLEGRLAFYLKSKIKGKYLITAQMDTTETQFNNMFSDFHGRDKETLFRNIDPERYYPVYADDSESWQDTNSQGKLYVRLDWDTSRAVFGNFNTNVNGSRYGQYERGLYGAQLDYKSTQRTEFNDEKVELNAFVSDPNTVSSYAEFLGTGGSIYLLKERNIVRGSDNLKVEVRDKRTSRVLSTRQLQESRDYEINYSQGRIRMNRPLRSYGGGRDSGQVVQDSSGGDTEVYLTVNYEYLPTGSFDEDNISAGVDGEYWINDHFGIGATHIQENKQSGSDYQLSGVKAQAKYSNETQMAVEYYQSKSSDFRGWVSDNGGTTFDQITITEEGARSGAFSTEGRLLLDEFSGEQNNTYFDFWISNVDEDFQNTNRTFNNEQFDFNLGGQTDISDKDQLKARFERTNVDGGIERNKFTAGYERALNSKESVELDLVHEFEKSTNKRGRGGILGARYKRDITDYSRYYVFGHSTFARNNDYEANDRVGLGGQYEVNQSLTVDGEVSTGSRGDDVKAGFDYSITNNYSIYTDYNYNNSDSESKNSIVTGQNYRYSSNLNVYQETEVDNGNRAPGLLNTFGLDYRFDNQWSAGGFLEKGNYDSSRGETRRRGVSAYVENNSEKMDYRGSIEYRRDSGGDDITNRVMTHRMNYDLNSEVSLYGLFDYAETKSGFDDSESNLYKEYAAGAAYRPINHDRLNLFSKYRYVVDEPGSGQGRLPEHKSNIISLEGVYEINHQFDVSSKLALRDSEIKLPDFNETFESKAYLTSIRGDYHVVKNWDAYIEARRLGVESEDNREGFLVGVDRHIGDNFKMGVGYNFTDFSDDMARVNDYTYEGVFLNIVGKY